MGLVWSRLCVVGAVIGAGSVALTMGCNAISGADTLSSSEEEQAPPPVNGVGGTTTPPSESSASSSSSGSTSGGTTTSTSSSTTSSGGGTTTSSTSTSSTSSSGSTGNPTNGAFLINELFDSGDACKTGAVTNGGVAQGDGAGGCQVCATQAGDTLYSLSTTLTTPKAITIDANVRRLGGASPTQAIVQLNIGGASISTAVSISTTFTRVGSGSASSSMGAQVTASIGIKGGVPGDCIVLDDLRVPVK